MYRLAAVNGAGIGMWSNAITATTLAVDTTLGEPSMVAATSSGGTITINWMPGANTASQVIVAVNTMDDTDYCLHVDTSGTLAEHECPNLTPGQTYVVLIIALDGQGGYELGNVVPHTAKLTQSVDRMPATGRGAVGSQSVAGKRQRQSQRRFCDND